MKVVNVVAIGMAGQGKSTFLNAFAFKPGDDDDDDYEPPFHVGSGNVSVTKNIANLQFHLPEQGLTVNLTDTMGFPDTDPATARVFYDTVVKECNKEQSAIVWIHKAARDNHGIISQLKVLLREFNQAAPPIYLIINGTENLSGLFNIPKKERLTLMAELRESHKLIGEEIAQKAGLKIAGCIAGADIGDLTTVVKKDLCRLLMCSTPQESNIKCLAQVEAEMKACDTAEKKAAYEKEKSQVYRDKAKKDQVDLENRIGHLDAVVQGLGIAAASAQCVPFVGTVIGAGLAATAIGINATKLAEQGKLGDALRAASEAAATCDVKQKEAANARVQRDECTASFDALKAALNIPKPSP